MRGARSAIRASALTAMLVMVAAAVTSHARAQERSGDVNVGDATLRYRMSGTGQTLVLIHGWALDLLIWDDQVAAFAPRYRVLRYDRRGFGESTGYADRTADPDDLRILMDSLGVRSAYVLGLSAGARVALDFAVAFPDRVDALVLYGSGPPQGFRPMPPSRGPTHRQIALDHGLDSLGGYLFAVFGATSPEARGTLAPHWSRYRGRDLFDPRPPSGRIPPAHVDQLGSVCVPTLVVRGEHEVAPLLPVADTLVARIPDARLAVIAGGGHGAHFQQPERFNRVVGEFLAEVDRGERRACPRPER